VIGNAVGSCGASVIMDHVILIGVVGYPIAVTIDESADFGGILQELGSRPKRKEGVERDGLAARQTLPRFVQERDRTGAPVRTQVGRMGEVGHVIEDVAAGAGTRVAACTTVICRTVVVVIAIRVMPCSVPRSMLRI